MQKNLTCRTLRDAQKDMCTYGLAFLPVNFLFLALGVLLAQLFTMEGIALPSGGDELLPLFVSQSGGVVAVPFAIGIVAASFSSADSALTSMTTCYCVDIKSRPDDERLRRTAHAAISAVFALFILLCHAIGSKSLLDAIYTLVSYTYGPLLGLFAYGLFTRRAVCDRRVPYVCVASPLLCLALDLIVRSWFGYRFGYELLLVNGLITYAGLWIVSSISPRSLRTLGSGSSAA